MIKIAPSVLSADFAALGQAVGDLERWKADYIHCDVMDGAYVPGFTFGHTMVAALRAYAKMPLDVHLMMLEPDRSIEKYADAGADLLTIHPGTVRHPHRTLQHIKAAGMKCGVALNPGESLSAAEYLLEECDQALIMTVNPGYGGQAFLPAMLRKIEALRRRREQLGLAFDIEVDGGINERTARQVIDAGATVLVAGNAVFTAADPAGMITRLRCGQ